MMTDTEYMTRALSLAERGRGRTSPNPIVGALVVSAQGIVVGAGFHERAGEPHAEVHALRAAGKRARGATLYCTLEPCCHAGRTGPCVERIVAAGVARVVAGVEDPNPLVNGRGFKYLREHGVMVETDVCRQSAARMNEAFFTFVRLRRPFVTMKIATSLDGRIAAARGRRTQMTSGAAQRCIDALRAEVDAIGVGSETILVDDPRLTARGVHRARPLTRVVFDRRLRTPPSAQVLATRDAGQVIIMTSREAVAASPAQADALVKAGAVLEIGEELPAAFTRLAALGITSLLLEGGARLHQAAWTAGLVDRVHVYISPVTLGEEGVPWLPCSTLSLPVLLDVRTQPCGPDVFIEGYAHRPD